VRAIAEGAFGTMVGLNGPDITRVPLAEVVGRAKNVPLDGDIIATARELGISLGD
jgi:6-phosphofructokinase 1